MLDFVAVSIDMSTDRARQISKEEVLNPIKQDIKKGKLRYVRNCFPHHGYLWNYGAFPQVNLPRIGGIRSLTLTDLGRPQYRPSRDQGQG